MTEGGAQDLGLEGATACRGRDTPYWCVDVWVGVAVGRGGCGSREGWVWQ